MAKKKETARKSKFDLDRDSYMSSDGQYYVYLIRDENGRKKTKVRIDAGKDGVTADMLRFLDEDDYYMDRLAEKARRNMLDPVIYTDCILDFIETLADGSCEYEYSRDEGYEHLEIIIRRIIEERCRPRQRKVYYQRFGMQMKLIEIAEKEAAESGQDKTRQAIWNVVSRIAKKVADETGLVREKSGPDCDDD